MIQIKHRFTGKVLLEVEGDTLDSADLFGANLKGANLDSANLNGADLGNANLEGADLYEADLSYANLRNANLSKADLIGANLSRADLTGADLKGTGLWGCIGNNKEIKTLQLGKYVVNICGENMQIGCKNFSIATWYNLSDVGIAKLDIGHSLSWWKQYKDILKQIIELNKGE